MFANCYRLKTAPNITMYSGCTVTSMAQMFSGCYSLESVPNYSFTLATNCSLNSTFYSCTKLLTAPTLVFQNTTGTMDMTQMFNICSSLRSVPAYNTIAVTNMNNTFLSCPSLQVAPNFGNTRQVTNVNGMFSGCGSLENIPAYDLNGVSSAANFTNFVLNTGVNRSLVTNVRFSHSYINCDLADTQLNEIYTNLPTITAQTITVTNNWGTATDNPAIATAKGWTVTG
jgi:hypothetical protein